MQSWISGWSLIFSAVVFLLACPAEASSGTGSEVVRGSIPETVKSGAPGWARTASEVELAAMDQKRLWGRPTVLADTGGRIRKVILQFSTPYLSDVIPAFHDFLSQLDPETTVVIACADAEEQEFLDRTVKEWDLQNPERIWLVNVNREITIWSRDRYLAFETERDDDRSSIVLPMDDGEIDEERRNDREVPLLVGSAMGEAVDWEISDLIFEGGDIIATDTHVFVGESTILSQETLSAEAAVRSLEALAGKEVVVVGNSTSSALSGHIDLFLTPVDDSALLLGDPSEGLALLAGDEAGRKKLEAAGIFTLRSQIEELALAYERVRAALVERGFEVRRVPIFHGIDSDGDFFKMTYNNVLMEDLGETRRVFLPRYGIEAVDTAAGRVYESLGFKVSRVDVSRVYLLGGTLRCMANVVKRAPSPRRVFKLPRQRHN